MKKLTARQKANRQAYNKQLKRIKQFITRAEKRGYRFEKNIIPQKPKNITKASVAKLAKITPEKLYKKATAISEETGKVITGEQRLKEERSERSRRAARTRAEKKLTKSLKGSKVQESVKIMNEPGFEEKRRKQDEEDLRRIRQEQEYRRMFDQGKLIYDRIMGMIDDVERDHKKAGNMLMAVFENEIKQYGAEKVYQAIAQAPEEVLELAEIAIRYNPGDNRNDDAIRELHMLITGYIPDIEELEALQESIDEDSYTDYGTE